MTLVRAYLIYHKIDRYLEQKPVKKDDVLRVEIASGITESFPQADTLILETLWVSCSNSDPDELSIVFDA